MKDETSFAIKEDEKQQQMIKKDLKKRILKLLKEPENRRCSECYSKKRKPKWMALIKAPIDANTETLGVFCCNNCYLYHEQLGPDLCTVKSLKTSEECT